MSAPPADAPVPPPGPRRDLVLLARRLAVVAVVAAATLAGVLAIARYSTSPALVNVFAQCSIGGAGLYILLTRPYLVRWLARVSTDQWRAIDAETSRTQGQAGATSGTVLAILVTTAIVLTLQEYIGGSDRFTRLFPVQEATGEFRYYYDLAGFAWWSGWRVLGYVIIPVIVLAFLPGERIRDYHIRPAGFFRHLWIYALLFACVLPAVIAASYTGSFRSTYPFYRLANRSQFDLWAWEGLYAIQFVSLEFFFRGFLLEGLRRALGSNAIFVMIVPYCMIHFGKPMSETLGAIGAGLILGTLAMRTRSIWGGVLIHIGVAVTMDVLALRGCPPIGSSDPCHP
ncbi:MAG: CPBP family intramembrane metalloprotease [Deltaproteobacteria bacterium]|nr:CPBP family intramembrane metalloprotease [Deltaproteobacteria bacterium]